MGKALIIKGADFSENGLVPQVFDITSLISNSGDYYPLYAIGGFGATNPVSGGNNKRCCLTSVELSTLMDSSQYKKIRMEMKPGFEFVFGTGPELNTTTGWEGWKGSTGGQTFSWVTDTNFVEFDFTQKYPSASYAHWYFCANFRKSDQSAFADDTPLSSIATFYVIA